MVIYGSPFPFMDIPHVTIQDLILKDFENFATREAFIDYTLKQSYTFLQVKQYSYSFGSALVKRGFKKGDAVLIYTANGIHYPVVICGTLVVGGIISTANPLYNYDELAHQLIDTKPKFLVCVPENLKKAQEAADKVGVVTTFIVLGNKRYSRHLNYEILIKDDGKAIPENLKWNVKEDVALILYSSGTTGLPKGVMLTHHNIVAALIGYSAIVPPSSADDISSYSISIQPLFHLAGLLTVIGLNQLRKSTSVLFTRFNLELYLQAVEKYKPFILSLPPPVVLSLAKSPLIQKYDISSVQMIVISTAKASAELENLAKDKLNIVFTKQAYGMTETSAVGTFMPLDREKVGSVGFPSPNIILKFVDIDTGKALPPGKLGEICLKGPQMMKGYINNPKANEEIFDEDGWLHTGDVGYIDEEGFIFIEDRIKELIKYKGYQVAPAELEGILISHSDIEDAAVIGLPDFEAGELPKAYVVRNNDYLTEKEVIDFIASKVAPHKYLRGGVEFIKEIPKTDTGKVLRRNLKQLALESTKSKL